MRAGLLNRLVHLQQISSIVDSDGFTSETWTDLATVWAQINPIGATERFEAAQTQEKITHQVTIRWRGDVTPKMRFLYVFPGTTQRIFLIHSILDPNEDHTEYNCLCEEYVVSQVGAA